MKSVGIDIGTSSIKVVEVIANNSGQLKITQYLEHPLGQNPAFDPEIEILEFLKGLSKAYDPASTRFVLGVRQEKVSVRYKTFPFNDKIKINKSLPFELEEDLPFSAESAIFDAKIIRYLGPTAEVLACATPKSRILEIINRFDDVGFDISILSAEGIAVANCFEKWFDAPPSLPSANLQIEKIPERKVSLILTIGHSRTLMNAYENGRLLGVRSILWGGKNVAEAIAKRYEIPYIEALKEMQTKAFILTTKEGASYDQIVFSDTIANQFKELTKDLKISILELNAELGSTIEAVGITGGTSLILNLEAFLTQMLELPVNKIKILDHFPTLGFEKNQKIDSLIGIALGLAIEGLKKPRNPPLQLLRGDFAHQNHNLKKFWENWGTTLRFALAFYIAFFVYSTLRENSSQSLVNRTVDNLKKQAQTVAKLSVKQANEAGVKKYIREQKKHAQELRTLSNLSNMNSALDILKKINDSSPAKSSVTLNVKKFSVEDNMVHIEGSVAKPAELSLLQRTLTGLSADGKVESKSPTISVPAGSTVFAFSLKVDRGIGRGSGSGSASGEVKHGL